MDTPDGKQNIIFINESGLYSLIEDKNTVAIHDGIQKLSPKSGLS